ncbi:MAG: type II toxin-antitoxin system PemK/MazF family toxin [Phycisphaerales bacterium]|nr:type II toxin-antitoxin system PemK/MazF family toxin [Phycisphaerales bacterium]
MPTHGALRRGDVVLVPLPFADLTGSKVRPAVVLSAGPQGPELIIAFITSVLTNRSLRGAEVEISRSDPEFLATGLKSDSLIRTDKLVTLSRTVVSRRLGVTGPATLAKLAAKLRVAFGL